MKQEQRKSNKQEKVKKAPRIEGINLQKTSIASAIMLENTPTLLVIGLEVETGLKFGRPKYS